MSKYLLSQGTINGLSLCAEYETVNVIIKIFLRKFFENSIQYIKRIYRYFQFLKKNAKHHSKKQNIKPPLLEFWHPISVSCLTRREAK